MKRKVQSLFIQGSAGRLEALWEQPEPARTDVAALVCHPHPLFGGTMHNKVVHHTAQALQEMGLAVLRFNFRGAGASAGAHDYGKGELADARAGLDFLEENYPGAGIVLAGFSFGAWVGLRIGCEENRVRALIGIGLPTEKADHAYLTECVKPKLFIQGTRDEFGPRADVQALIDQAAEPKQVVFIEGADHFFTGHLDQLRQAILNHFPFN